MYFCLKGKYGCNVNVAGSGANDVDALEGIQIFINGEIVEPTHSKVPGLSIVIVNMTGSENSCSPVSIKLISRFQLVVVVSKIYIY